MCAESVEGVDRERVPLGGGVECVVGIGVAGADRLVPAKGVVLASARPLTARIGADLAERVDDHPVLAEDDGVVAVEVDDGTVGEVRCGNDCWVGRGVSQDEHVAVGNLPLSATLWLAVAAPLR